MYFPSFPDEGNWRNDYPDEDEGLSDSSQERRFYEDYGFDSGELIYSCNNQGCLHDKGHKVNYKALLCTSGVVTDTRERCLIFPSAFQMRDIEDMLLMTICLTTLTKERNDETGS